MLSRQRDSVRSLPWSLSLVDCCHNVVFMWFGCSRVSDLPSSCCSRSLWFCNNALLVPCTVVAHPLPGTLANHCCVYYLPMLYVSRHPPYFVFNNRTIFRPFGPLISLLDFCLSFWGLRSQNNRAFWWQTCVWRFDWKFGMYLRSLPTFWSYLLPWLLSSSSCSVLLRSYPFPVRPSSIRMRPIHPSRSISQDHLHRYI